MTYVYLVWNSYCGEHPSLEKIFLKEEKAIRYVKEK